VKEYWIVDPLTQYLHAFILSGSRYSESQVYERNEIARSSVFADLEIDLRQVFEDEKDTD
jgi:Uma2 family endonuclease